jgi:hypothetical protein
MHIVAGPINILGDYSWGAAAATGKLASATVDCVAEVKAACVCCDFGCAHLVGFF